MRERIEAVLETLRPAIRKDGGELDVVSADPETGRVEVRFRGACASCALSGLTLRLGVEALLKREVPEVREVVAVQA